MPGWYLRRGEKVVGPVEIDKLKELVVAGKLLPTDLLANDVAGPWKEAGNTSLFAKDRTPAPPAPEVVLHSAPNALVPKVEQLPTVAEPVHGSTTATAVRVSGAIVATMGRGALAVIKTVSRSLAARAQRKHELKLAKIQAQALTESHRHPVAHDGSSAPSTLPPATSIIFAPQIVQSTGVKAVSHSGAKAISRSSSGWGCSGWGLVLLLVLLGIFVFVILQGTDHGRRADRPAHPIAAEPDRIDAESESDSAAEELEATVLSEQQAAVIDDAGFGRIELDPTMIAEQLQSTVEDAEFRTWTSASGAHSSEAKIVSYASGVVTLENREGKRTRVDSEKLSDSDREFINNWKRNRRHAGPGSENEKTGVTPSATILSSKIVDFTNPSGGKLQNVVVRWKNTGSKPIRAMEADITHWDDSGAILGKFNYTIFAVSDREPGVAPGEVHTTRGTGLVATRVAGSNFADFADRLQRRSAKVDVRITNVDEYSGF